VMAVAIKGSAGNIKPLLHFSAHPAARHHTPKVRTTRVPQVESLHICHQGHKRTRMRMSSSCSAALPPPLSLSNTEVEQALAPEAETMGCCLIGSQTSKAAQCLKKYAGLSQGPAWQRLQACLTSGLRMMSSTGTKPSHPGNHVGPIPLRLRNLSAMACSVTPTNASNAAARLTSSLFGSSTPSGPSRHTMVSFSPLNTLKSTGQCAKKFLSLSCHSRFFTWPFARRPQSSGTDEGPQASHAWVLA